MIKKFVYISVITSLIGASVISIDFNIFQLSVFRICIMFILFALIVQMLLIGGRINLLKNKKNGYSIKFMIVWMLYSIISIAWVKNYGDWFRAVYFTSIGVVSIIIYNKYFDSTANILKAFRGISLMVIVHNFIGWYEIFTGNYLFIGGGDKMVKYSFHNYPVSMFNNTNNFALFMFFSVFIVYACMVNARFKLIKSIYFITIISSIVLLLSTNSRASLLGLILALIVYAYLSIVQKRWRYPILLFLSMSFLIIIIPSVFSNVSPMVDKFLMIDLSADNGSDFVRFNLIKNGFAFLFRTFGFGTGAGNIEHWMGNYAVYNTFGIVNMHNWWMEILVSSGMFIFTLYLFFYIKLMRDMLHKFKLSSNKRDKTLAIAIVSCMAGYIIASSGSSSNIGAEWLWVFWAISIAYQGIDSEVSYEKTV